MTRKQCRATSRNKKRRQKNIRKKSNRVKRIISKKIIRKRKLKRSRKKLKGGQGKWTCGVDSKKFVTACNKKNGDKNKKYLEDLANEFGKKHNSRYVKGLIDCGCEIPNEKENTLCVCGSSITKDKLRKLTKSNLELWLSHIFFDYKLNGENVLNMMRFLNRMQWLQYLNSVDMMTVKLNLNEMYLNKSKSVEEINNDYIRDKNTTYVTSGYRYRGVSLSQYYVDKIKSTKFLLSSYLIKCERYLEDLPITINKSSLNTEMDVKKNNNLRILLLENMSNLNTIEGHIGTGGSHMLGHFFQSSVPIERFSTLETFANAYKNEDFTPYVVKIRLSENNVGVQNIYESDCVVKPVLNLKEFELLSIEQFNIEKKLKI